MFLVKGSRKSHSDTQNHRATFKLAPQKKQAATEGTMATVHIEYRGNIISSEEIEGQNVDEYVQTIILEFKKLYDEFKVVIRQDFILCTE